MPKSPFLSYFFLKDGVLNTRKILQSEPSPNDLTEILEDFTNTYRQFSPEQIELREAACVNVQLAGRVRPIMDEDLFAGRLEQMPIGFVPQSKGTGMGYCFHPDLDEMLLSRSELSAKSKQKLEKIVGFWQEHGTVFKSRKKMPKRVTKVLPSELYYLESGIAFTLYRMSGIQLDYRKLLEYGIGGLKALVTEKRKIHQEGTKEFDLYTAMLSVLNTFTELCRLYAWQADTLAKQSSNDVRKQELTLMSGVLNNIAEKKPSSFREGLQLMYLFNGFDDAKNYGRMDDYMADLYTEDLRNGRIDDKEAIRLLKSIWTLMKSRDNRYDTRLIIGGLGRKNETKADKVATLILETSHQVKENVPQIALRFHKNQDPMLYNKGLDILGAGNTYPMLYNDEVNVPSTQKAFGVTYEEAIHSIQYGCGEYVLNHRSVGTPSGVINLLQALLVTMNRGIDPSTGKYQGMPIECYIKYNNFECFDALFEAYKEQVEYHVGPLALQERLEYQHAAEDNAYLSTSLLMDDCIERGKAIFNGGIRYLGGTLETYGNTNAADSLLAIKKVVYDQQKLSISQLIHILKLNFKGYERERKLLLECPKYGNNNDEADEMYLKVHEHICKCTATQAKKVGLDSYLVVVINNDANTVMGTFTAASPDGREAQTYLNPANNPAGGADKNGVTSMLNSLAKPASDIHAGAVQNMKFSKDLLTKHRAKFETLLGTYFKLGGAQAMLNVLDKNDLINAQKEPEKYQNLIVRVGGFSERFVNLPLETQNEVLSRTLHS